MLGPVSEHCLREWRYTIAAGDPLVLLERRVVDSVH